VPKAGVRSARIQHTDPQLIRVERPDLLPNPLALDRGAGKKKIDGPARTFAKSQTHPPTVFGRFSARGVKKTPYKYFCKKSMSTTFSKQIGKKIDVSDASFSSTFFVFGCFSAMGVQQHTKKRFTKNIVSKGERFLQQTRPKTPKPTFSR
jgi:hypothetical protein